MTATTAAESVVDLRRQFQHDGFVVIRGLLAPAEVARYVARLSELANGKTPWTQPDGVNQHAEFWPLATDERLTSPVRALLGPAIRYLPHSDLHVGFSSFSWHRDNVTRDAGIGADWDESEAPYRLVRVGIYLQRFETSDFRLGLIPGSHRVQVGTRPRYRGTGTVARILSGVSGVDLVGREAVWIATEPGDCVIFDPRILHTGSKCRGPKFSIFLAYGLENRHFHRHWHYYLNLRTDLAYSTMSPEFAARLHSADLLAGDAPTELTIEGAWLPSPAFTYVARHFK